MSWNNDFLSNNGRTEYRYGPAVVDSDQPKIKMEGQPKLNDESWFSISDDAKLVIPNIKTWENDVVGKTTVYLPLNKIPLYFKKSNNDYYILQSISFYNYFYPPGIIGFGHFLLFIYRDSENSKYEYTIDDYSLRNTDEIDVSQLIGADRIQHNLHPDHIKKRIF